MDLHLKELTETTLEIEFAGEDHTLLNLLKQELLARDDVETATYLSGHPSLDEPRLVVEVTKGDPRKAVKEAAKAVRQRLDELDTAVLQASE